MFRARTLALACLFLFGASSADVAWALAHGLFEHGHESHSPASHDETPCAELAVLLTHGHVHSGPTPSHEHAVREAPASRPAKIDPASPVADSTICPYRREDSALSSAAVSLRSAWPEPAHTGTGPPDLALLCTLRI